MSEQKKFLPQLRFSEFRGAEAWDSEPMGQVYSFKGNNSLPRDKLNYAAGSVKNIHYGDIHTKFSTHFDITQELVPFINEAEEGVIRDENLCIEGDMIFADASEDLADIGKAIEIAHLNGERVVSGLHTILARRIGERIALGFGGHLFKSGWVRTQIQKEAQGAKVLGISPTRLRNVRLSLPHDPGEQQKIADCLSSLDELIAAQARKVDALKTHKKGLMQQLFPREGETQPRLRFPEFKNAGAWEFTTVGGLVETGYLFPPKDGNHGNIHPKSSDYVANGIPFIMASDLSGGLIEIANCHFISKELADTLQKGFAKEGDVLLSHKGTVGEVAVVPKINTPYLMLTPQVTYYRVKDRKKLSNEFLAQLFVADAFQANLVEVSGGGTRAYIGITEQAKLRLQLPKGVEEQQRIATCLSNLDNQITATAQELETVKTHKKGLMQQLFPSAEAVKA